MYSSQPAHLATTRGFRGLSMILAAIVILAIATLAVGVYATAVGAPKAQVGDHSQDLGEGTRAGAYVAADRSLDQVEMSRRVAFSKAHHKVAPVTVVTAPVTPANDSWDSLRKEHLRVSPAAEAALAKTAQDNLIAFRRAQAAAASKAAAAAIATDDWNSLRMEHVRGVPSAKTAPVSNAIDALREATGRGR